MQLKIVHTPQTELQHSVTCVYEQPHCICTCTRATRLQQFQLEGVFLCYSEFLVDLTIIRQNSTRTIVLSTSYSLFSLHSSDESPTVVAKSLRRPHTFTELYNNTDKYWGKTFGPYCIDETAVRKTKLLFSTTGVALFLHDQ